jgi:ParB-like chromosome segregation protein Spo0J
VKKKRKKTTAGAKSRDKARSLNTGKNKQPSGSGSALRVALRLAAEDVPLVPRYGKVNGRCTCGNENCERPGRHSPSGISTADATADPQVIRRWWKKWPNPWPGIVIGGELGIIAVVSEGAEGEATERKLRERGKIFKKTITIRDHQRKIRLYYAWVSDVPYGTEIGPGLRLLREGEIVKAPSRLQGGDSIQFLDGRAPGEISLTSVPDWLVEPTKRVDERLPNDEAKLNVRPSSDPRQLDPRFEDGEIRVDDVLIRPDHDELDDEVVTAIAESPTGPFTPIIVRRIPPEEQPKPREHKVELISGRQRLQAARLRGMDTIKCRFFTGTRAAALLLALEEDLFRKKVTALQKAERFVRWAEQLRKTGYHISGQVVQKKRGRPESWITGAMRQLPVVGRSIEARRKEFKRASKIASIASEAKDIIVKSRALADNKTALKAIARESGRNAQVRKAKELAEKAQELRLLTKAKPPAAAGDKSKGRAVKKSPPLQPHSGGLPEASAEGDGADDEPASLQVPKETTLDELNDFWKAGGPKLWKYASFSVRTAFKEKLDRAPYAATSDVVEFIDKVFCGRKGVNVRQLYTFAKTQGIPRKILRVHLRALGYKLTKDGPQPAAPRFYRNKNSEWKNQLRVIPDAELEAPLAAEQKGDEQDESDLLDERPPNPYYADI